MISNVAAVMRCLQHWCIARQDGLRRGGLAEWSGILLRCKYSFPKPNHAEYLPKGMRHRIVGIVILVFC